MKTKMTKTRRKNLIKLKSAVSEILTTAQCYDKEADKDIDYGYKIARLHRFIVRAKLGHGIEFLDLREALFIHLSKQTFWMDRMNSEKWVAECTLGWFQKHIHNMYNLPDYWSSGSGYRRGVEE